MKLTTKILNNTICQLKRAIKFYNYVKNQLDQPPEYNTVASDAVPDEKQLASMLYTSGREVCRVLKLAKSLESLRGSSLKLQSKVKFKEDGQTFLDFLSCFDFGVPGLLGLQKDVSYDKKCQICNYYSFIHFNLCIDGISFNYQENFYFYSKINISRMDVFK